MFWLSTSKQKGNILKFLELMKLTQAFDLIPWNNEMVCYEDLQRPSIWK